jgi:hypothetical protein
MDAIQQRLNDAVSAMLDKVDMQRLRPLHKDAYLKMAACHDKRNASAQEIQHCVQGCGRKMEAANQIIQAEMGQLQNRLERCSMGCQDEVRDAMHGKDNSQANQEMAERLALKCTGSCVNKHMDLLKSVQHKLESDIDRMASQHN